MKTLLLLALALGLASLEASAQPFIPGTQQTTSIVGTVGTALLITNPNPATTGPRVYVTAIALVPVATATIQFISGTGATCATGTVNLTGVMTFSAGQTVMIGDGYGAVLVAGPGLSVCAIIAVAVAPGLIAFAII